MGLEYLGIYNAALLLSVVTLRCLAWVEIGHHLLGPELVGSEGLLLNCYIVVITIARSLTWCESLRCLFQRSFLRLVATHSLR